MEDRNYLVTRDCPRCGNMSAQLMPPLGDFSEYRCLDCGTYRISGTMQKLTELGTVNPRTARFVERGGHRFEQ
jgi:tRNA(Ile2) C34 agmatinyltransferase TiaS